jgi:Activator of Hsp90 ATPase homolog 1-like protein
MKAAGSQPALGEKAPEVVQGDYTTRVTFRAPRERVFDAIATPGGVRSWWTTSVRGSGEAGGELRLEFEGLDEYIVLRVEKASRPFTVQWSCVVHSSLPEWAGTKMLFDLVERTPDECELSFRHVGLAPQLECYEDCRLGWDHFLMSLVGYAERGRGTPWAYAAR